MCSKVCGFVNEYYILSNSALVLFRYKGHTYMSVDAAFAANYNPIYKSDEYAIGLMKSILHAKFTTNIDAEITLLKSKDMELINSNSMGDIYWGTCNGYGLNMLGILLMDIRNTAYSVMTIY